MALQVDPVLGRSWRLVAPAVATSLAILALLLLLLLAAWVISPWLAQRLTPALAVRLDLDALAVEIERPGWHELAVRRLQFSSGRIRVDARDGRIAYRLADLLSGRGEWVRFGVVEVVAGKTGSAAGDAGSVALPAIESAALFAALPVRHAEVGRLDFSVPAMDFAASGGLALDGRTLELVLTGSAPAQAVGWRLRFDANHLGNGRLRVSEQSRLEQGTVLRSAPLVDLRLVQGPDGLDLSADLRVSGFALDLAAELLALPAGRGSIEGSARSRLPWPVPAVPDWRRLDFDGNFAFTWAPAQGDWQIGPIAGQWQMAAGVLTGGLAGSVEEGGKPVAVAAQAAGLDLTGEFPHGLLGIVVGPEARPMLDLEASLGGDRMTLGGKFSIDERDWQRIGGRTGWLPGRGKVVARISAAAPWGRAGSQSAASWLPPPGSYVGDAAITTLAWSMDGGVATLEDATGTLRFSGAALEGEIAGRLRLASMATDSRVTDSTGTESKAADPVLADANMTAPVAPSTATTAPLASGDASPDAAFAGLLPLETRFRTADLLADPLRFEGTVRSGALGPLEGSIRFAAETGAIEFRAGGDQVVSTALMAAVFESWTAPWDLDAGRLSLAANLGWSGSGNFGGLVTLSLREASAHFAEFLLAGLDGEFAIALSDVGWQLAPTDLRATRLTAGIELTDVTARVEGDPDSLRFEQVGARVFGGAITAGPFDYDIRAGAARLDVTLTSIDLAQALALYGERIAGTGLLDGTLPVTLAEGVVTIGDGRLSARSPGGVIKVAPELLEVTGQPGLDFALRALGNFTYTQLDAEVDYAANGDMALAVALRGRNPDVEAGRPIHYNLNVSENVPQLIEALTVDRDLLDVIERRVRR